MYVSCFLRRFFWAGALCIILAGVNYGDATAAPGVRNPNGVAVMVGNRDYEDRDIPDVSYAHRDADAFRRYVVEVLGFNPENIIDLRDARRRRMFDVLGTRKSHQGELWSYLDPDGGSDVVVFYSGHGVPGLKDKRGYLLPVDGSPNAAEDDGYPIDLLYGNLGKLEEARSVVVYLDACFSGASPEGNLTRSASPVYVRAALTKELSKKVTALTAATGKQLASWDNRARHGLFTHHLLDALYGKGDGNKDGRVTAEEAKEYLDRRMTRAARRQYRRIQHASLSGAGGVVLSAAASGGFPERPSLDGGSQASKKKKAVKASKPPVVKKKGKPLAGIVLPDGITLADWVLLAEEQLKSGEHVRLLAEAKAHLRVYGSRKPVESVLERAVSGLVKEVRALVEQDARAGLSRIGRLEASAGKRPSLVRLKVRAYGLLGDLRSQEGALVEWLGLAPQSHPERAEVLKELFRVRSVMRAVAVEEKLGLGQEARALVQGGLASLGLYGGSVDGAFGERTREAIRAFQKGKGHKETGRLTKGQAERLVALGERAEAERRVREKAERERKAREVREARERAERERKAKAKEARERMEAERRARERAAREAREAREKAERERKAREARERMEAERKAQIEALYRRWPAGKVFRDCQDCPQMVVIPVGSFMMGSPPGEKWEKWEVESQRPRHRVTIAKPFAVSKYEVTFAEWDACVRDGGCEGYRPDNLHWGRGRRPVIYVTWSHAKAYVRWLSLKTGKKYRLLSESEWEYAARAGSTTQYSWGDDIGHNRANCRGCGSQWDDNMRTAPVGSFSANRFGLHDMHGNVWEWVEDCWNKNYRYAPTDGRAWTDGDCSQRVLRGGSWSSTPGRLRSASRGWYGAGFRGYIYGFRVARTLSP